MKIERPAGIHLSRPEKNAIFLTPPTPVNMTPPIAAFSIEVVSNPGNHPGDTPTGKIWKKHKK